MDVKVRLFHDLWPFVPYLAHAVEDTPQHVDRDTYSRRLSRKPDPCLQGINAACALVYLDDSHIFRDIEDLPCPLITVWRNDPDDLTVGDPFHVLDKYQR